MTYESTANGITVTTQCYTCIEIERACDEHADLKEANDTAIAYALVDDGNLQYPRTWSWLKDQPSGHDFIAPLVRVEPYTITKFSADGLRVIGHELNDERTEFAPQTTLLTDRLFDDPDTEIHSDELLCSDCNLTYYGKMSVCPNCN